MYLTVYGSASAGCCRAGRVLTTHFSHVCLDVCLRVRMPVCMDGCLGLYVCVRLFSLYILRGRLRPWSGVIFLGGGPRYNGAGAFFRVCDAVRWTDVVAR